VESYRLIGYENRVMDNEDFENDRKDAGEIGAGQTITALYEIVPGTDWGARSRKPIAKFDFRYKKQLGDESVLLESNVTTSDGSKMSPNLSFASGVAAYGMLLRYSEYAGTASYRLAYDLVENSMKVIGSDDYQYRLREELLRLIDRAEKINGE